MSIVINCIATTSIFGGASVSAAPVAAASTPSIFGGSSTPAAPANNMFGAKAATDGGFTHVFLHILPFA